MNKYTKAIVSVIAALSITLIAGCDGSSKKKPAGPEYTPGVDAALVNAPGEAWIDAFRQGQREGFILEADGKFTFVSDVTGSWTISGTGYVHAKNNEIVSLTGGAQFYYGGTEAGLISEYTLAGGKLVLKAETGDYTFEKVTGVDPTGDTPPGLIKSRN